MKYTMRNVFLFIGLLWTAVSFASPGATPNPHQAASGQRIYGKVVKKIETRNYTYVQINTGSKKFWAAGPKTNLKKGSMIAINTGMPFKNFESKELKRKFDTVYFVGQFITDQPGSNSAKSNPHAGMKMPAQNTSIKGIKRLKDGKTVDEVFSQKKALVGKTIRVRGKVVKYTGKVMGRNWLHIQDSSSTRKLVVTTDQEVDKGDLVVVNGTVAVDQDLGYGYIYEIIVERAIVSKE